MRRRSGSDASAAAPWAFYYNGLATKDQSNASKGLSVLLTLDLNQFNGNWVKKTFLYLLSFNLKAISLFFHRIRFNG
jgi:hypothetical protein